MPMLMPGPFYFSVLVNSVDFVMHSSPCFYFIIKVQNALITLKIKHQSIFKTTGKFHIDQLKML